MADNNDKNLNEMLEKIIGAHPAPVPDEKLLVEIRYKVHKALVRKKIKRYIRLTYRSVAVAASLAILSIITARIVAPVVEDEHRIAAMPTTSQVVWESDDSELDDSSIATLAAEIAQAESELLAARLGDYGEEKHEAAVSELEMELIEIESDFWKG